MTMVRRHNSVKYLHILAGKSSPTSFTIPILFHYSHSPSSSSVVQIGFSPTLYEVEESSGVVTFFVEDRNAELEREVTVVFTTIEGSAEGML